MYKTVNAIYQHGKIVPLEDLSLEEESKLLVTVLSEPKKKKSNWKEIRGKYKGCLSSVDEFLARKKSEKELEL